MKGRILPALLVAMLLAGCPPPHAGRRHIPQYEENPFSFVLDIPAPEDSAGGIIVADLDRDGLLDYVVTVPGHIAAYGHAGNKLWVAHIDVRVGASSERVGLPGHNGPGVQAADIDGDNHTEVLFLTQDSRLHVMAGANGEKKWSVALEPPEGAERWEHAVVANFRGKGLRDVLLQATNAEGYRVGHHLAAFALDALEQGRTEPLWQRDDFLACAHNGARIADLDGDGRHEVLSGDVLSPTGELRYKIPLKGHIDSIFVADVRPDVPGLEVVALEEGGGNRVFLFNAEGLLWETDYQHWEPQNAAVGQFDLGHAGLEVWCRSRFNTHQKPFVFDALGQLITQYEMDNVAPEDWTASGVEVIYAIHWTGDGRQLAAAKERHTSGDVAVFDPISGAFVARFEDKADRFFVADVSGDWREELVVLAGNELRIYHNPEPNPNPHRPRLWRQPHYRDSRMTYNYYSP